MWFFLKEFLKEYGDFGIPKQTLTRLREKNQGDFQGSKIGTLKSFYSS